MPRNHKFNHQDKAWLDWLSDDAPAKVTPRADRPVRPLKLTPKQLPQTTGRQFDLGAELRAATKQPSAYLHVPQPARKPSKKVPNVRSTRADGISIQIAMPEVRMPKIRINRAKVIRIGVPILVLGSLLVGGNFWLNNRSDSTSLDSSGSSSTPSYAPLKSEAVASGKAVNGVQPTYDPKKELYTFYDTYKGARLTVSQQPMPDKLKQNPETLKKVAESVGAKDSFTTAYGNVYISTDPEAGSQRLVLAHRQLLLFIQSSVPLDKPTWVAYIQSLQ